MPQSASQRLYGLNQRDDKLATDINYLDEAGPSRLDNVELAIGEADNIREDAIALSDNLTREERHSDVAEQIQELLNNISNKRRLLMDLREVARNDTLDDEPE